MKNASAVAWAADEFGGVELSDARWRRRLVEVAKRAARRPAGKITAVFRNDAERQGAYGLLESNAVPATAVAHAVFAACAKRCATERFVFCAVDGSSLTLADRAKRKFGPIGIRGHRARGLKVMSALAVSSEGVTLGLTAQVWWARSESRPKKHRWARKTEEKETQYWRDVMAQTRAVMSSHAPETRVWFQLDREGDAWPILEQVDTDGHWFTIRGSHDRRVVLADGRKAHLRALVGSHPVATRYSLDVPAAPKRRARVANMAIRACQATLDLKDKRTNHHSSKIVNVVLVREEGTTPRGEKPIEWLLLTNRPVATHTALREIVYGYSLRWRIENFHQSWKSGVCRVEETQLRSQDAVIKWSTILAAVATRVERLKLLSRQTPDQPATDEFTPVELRALKLLRFGKKANSGATRAKVPTLAEATLWVAKLGGYIGKSSGGPPGSVTIARGLADLEVAARALEALDPTCD